MRVQLLQPVLVDLNASSTDILASAVISIDGLPIAAEFAIGQKQHEVDRVGAMSAALLALGMRTTRELACGDLEQVIVKGTAGYILLMQAAPETVLLVHAKEDAKLGLILLDTRRAVKAISEIID